jgi:hypothetical protein
MEQPTTDVDAVESDESDDEDISCENCNRFGKSRVVVGIVRNMALRIKGLVVQFIFTTRV